MPCYMLIGLLCDCASVHLFWVSRRLVPVDLFSEMHAVSCIKDLFSVIWDVIYLADVAMRG